jgi:predicted RNA-binding Zn-ribbon protein involved in translation (DUF1610 family)
MPATSKMICPKCGAEMNHHAEKIDYLIPPDEADEVDAYFGGVLEEIYACPSCGNIEMRKADAG